MKDTEAVSGCREAKNTTGWRMHGRGGHTHSKENFYDWRAEEQSEKKKDDERCPNGRGRLFQPGGRS